MKLSCDIIQDLIPSYVEEICSEASKICVDEHLESCAHCQKMVELYRNSAFSGGDLEQKELDGLKKVKNKLKRQNLFSYLLLLFICFFGLYTFGQGTQMPLTVYYVLLVVCLLSICLCTPHAVGLKSPGRPDFCMTGSSVFLSVFSLLVMYLGLLSATREQIPFGLEPHELGPLVSGCFNAFFILQLALTAGLLLRMFRNDRNNRSLLCLTLTGAFLPLTYRVLLNRMDTLAVLQAALLQITLIVVIPGIVGAGLCLLLPRKKHTDSCPFS